jgi:hypothetical protein
VQVESMRELKDKMKEHGAKTGHKVKMSKQRAWCLHLGCRWENKLSFEAQVRELNNNLEETIP